MTNKETIMPETLSRIVPIFAGGGTRATVHIGILHALKELNIHFDHLVGVSGGSIISSLLAVGLNLDEIKDIALNQDFTKFRGQSLLNLIRTGGLSTGSSFESWMDELLKGVTFAELDVNLHIVATDVKSGKPVIFDKEFTPNTKVSKAVRFSVSIPLLFSFEHFGDYIMTDGAILSGDALHRDWAGDGTPLICFRLRGDQLNDESPEESILPIAKYISMLLRTFMTTISHEYVSDAFWDTTIVVDTGTISPVDFSLTREIKESLIKIGYDTAMQVVPLKINREHLNNVAVKV